MAMHLHWLALAQPSATHDARQMAIVRNAHLVLTFHVLAQQTLVQRAAHFQCPAAQKRYGSLTKRMRPFLIFSAAWVVAGGVQAQLVSQETNGINRLCIYEKEGVIARRRDILRIGLGQPCPDRMPPVEEPRDTTIPFMAQLSRSVVRNGRTVCIYSFANQHYERALEPGLSCPITPRFLDR